MKVCTRCKIYKTDDSFYASKATPTGLASWCKKCKSDYQKSNECRAKGKIRDRNYYLENKESKLEANKKYRAKNPERMKIYQREYMAKRRSSNIEVRIADVLRGRLGKAISKKYKKSSAVKDLGCTMKEFISFIESKFTEGMSWDNYGEWHFDHKIPLSLFNLKHEPCLKKAIHYTNIQPLWASENISKGNRVF